MGAFAACCDLVLGHEGGFTRDPADRGNWTGGAVGAGQLRGTKWGISAASFPTLDIATLSQDDARAIYKGLYWDRVLGDHLPPALALLAFDSAVNNGVGAAAKLLQHAVGAVADGLLGTGTLAALRAAVGNGDPGRVEAVCAEFQAQRLMMMISLSTWPRYGLGWARRLVRLPYQAARLPT